MKRLLRLPVLAYRFAVSPLLPPSCRFHPACSAYALGVLEKHGALKGIYLAARRLLRCHPWSRSPALDPVPPARPRGVCAPPSHRL